MPYALVIHGGAGAQPSIDYREQRAHLTDLITKGRDLLQAGSSALDVVTEMVAEMEACGLYVAGKGSAPNTAGAVELDASIMTGQDQRAGAVAAVQGILHPIKAARQVMEDGRHVMLAGQGATDFALAQGAERVSDPSSYYSEHTKHGSGTDSRAHGTVGAVALDLTGNLAAATSTGGTFNKRPGRVGDTPLIGSGTWADDLVAVSCTGVGEAFIRAAAAHNLSARLRYAEAPLSQASRAVLDDVAKCDGNGGLIAVDHRGNISMPYNSKGMKRAAVSSSLPVTVRVFEPEEL
ncbi:isoaspartyl peptidase/L-asparaginase family protein [Rhodovibrionaceae bacterium A322]